MHFWGSMDVHRNNAFSSVAMEAAYREGEEWLEQLLEYISGNLEKALKQLKDAVDRLA